MRKRQQRYSARGFLWLFAVLGFAATLPAQMPELERVQIEGVVEEMLGGVLRVADTQGTSWLVKLEAMPQDILYSGTAQPDWLAPGMWVRFRLTVNQKRQPDGPIHDLTVFTPQNPGQIGIVEDVTLGKELFGGAAEEAKPSKEKKVSYTVAGRITQVRRNKMTVLAGDVPVAVDLSPDAKVVVEVSDLSLVAKGDKITIEGLKYPMVPGRLVARRVTVTGAAPLMGPKSRHARAVPPPKQPPSEKKPGADKP